MQELVFFERDGRPEMVRSFTLRAQQLSKLYSGVGIAILIFTETSGVRVPWKSTNRLSIPC